jgi:F0F1-type ATP synthase assembly protein I
MSASELRRRYAPGGELRDDELTAAQLRARHSVRSNTKDFSTREGGREASSGYTGAFILGLSVIVVVGVAIALGWIKF